VGSAHVLEKLGMRQEGWLRENEFYKGRWWDTLMYAVLDREWQAQPHPPLF
jgi:[ribosomal protein S5]-alanine N-acetyltransferase